MHNPEVNDKPIDTTKRDSFVKLVTKKQLRWSEFLAEKLITFIALLSITVIVLIFVFVFREAFPIFKSKNVAKDTTQTQQHKDSLQPETYGGTEELVPENYGGTEELAPESYGLNTDSIENQQNTNELVPESYGEVVDTSFQAQTNNNTSGNSSGGYKAGENEDVSIWEMFIGKVWQPVSEHPRFGLIPLFLGTLKITLIAILFAAPISIMAAIYTSSFASPKTREIVKPVIELLAGFPSVVIGFFALMILATLLQELFGYSSRLNGFVGGFAMALAAIPVIYTLTEDALSSVPKTYKEASLALGASRWQTALFVTLPAATPGVFAAVLLGVGRVFGETMIALMATGNAAIVSANPFDSVRTLSATIGAEMAEVVFGDTHYSVLFFIGALLFLFTFILNAIAEFYIKGRLIKKIQGK